MSNSHALLVALVAAANRMCKTPIVDDDFPEVQHGFHSALRGAEDHLKASQGADTTLTSNSAHRALYPLVSALKKSAAPGAYDAVIAITDGITAACAEHNEVLEQVRIYHQRFNLLTHLYRQRAWSEATFGPGDRRKGIIDHIRKELVEIEHAPKDVTEWIDVAILALDGAWRSGASPEQIIAALEGKQTKNEGRTWPDWRTQAEDKAIEHDRSADPDGLPTDIQPPAELEEQRETSLLVFAGYSDDTFGEYALTNDDFDNSASGKPIEWLVTAPDGEQLLVVGQYCPGAANGWLVGVARYGDDDEADMPEWPMSIAPGERSYSPALLLSAPVGSTIRCLQREDDEQG